MITKINRKTNSVIGVTRNGEQRHTDAIMYEIITDNNKGNDKDPIKEIDSNPAN